MTNRKTKRTKKKSHKLGRKSYKSTRTFWTGSMPDVVFASIYLMTKHKNICFPYNPSRALDYEDIMVMFSYKNESSVKKLMEKVVEKRVSQYTNSNYYEYYEKNNNIDLLKNVSSQIRKEYKFSFPGGKTVFLKMLKSCKKRYIMLPLYFEWIDGAHANIILIDLEKRTAERFEPYGKLPLFFFIVSDIFDNMMLTFLRKHLGGDMKYIKPLTFCPERSLQTLNEDYGTEYYGDPDGFCAAWTTWFIDMRLENPNMDRAKLISKSLSRIKKEDLKRYIRRYAVVLDAHRIEMLKTLTRKNSNSKCKCDGKGSCSVTSISDICFSHIYGKYLTKILAKLSQR